MMPGSDCLIVIPARYGSTRLPGKPLIRLAGKSMIEWVVEAALQSKKADGVLVATDHSEIARVAQSAGAEVFLTDSNHQNGTERLLEVVEHRQASFYLNLQGDEPLLDPLDIDRLIDYLMQCSGSEIISFRHLMHPSLADDPSRVKVVCDQNGRALYFSRSPIPYGSDQFWQHIGVYGFSCSALNKIRKLLPSPLEVQESLEQLRWLEAGLTINLIDSSKTSQCVDTAADIKPVEQTLKLRQIKALLCDVDGVLTDGKVWYGPYGEQLKPFHVRDGAATKALISNGIKLALVSGRDSQPLRRRMFDLGIHHAILGQSDKATACKQIAEELSLELHQLAYIGDETIDLPGMSLCGWSFAVADASNPVKVAADTVLKTTGGNGVLREVAELLLGEKYE